MGSLNIEKRRSHLREHTSLDGKILEVGPYDQPTLQKSECDVHYLDYQTREELLKPITDEKQRAAIPETDYIVKSDIYTDWIEDKFDVIVANHVFEHVPNPIAWLKIVGEMLVEDGVLFMALPDKKFTFDKYRADTAFSHILHDYLCDTKKASHEHLIEDALYYDQEFINKAMTTDKQLDFARLKAVMEREPHIGLHCHVFQSETFLAKVLKPILFMKLVRFDIVGFYPAPENYGEFMVVLKKRDPSVELDASEFFTKDYESALPTVEIPSVPPGASGLRAKLGRLLGAAGRKIAGAPR